MPLGDVAPRLRESVGDPDTAHVVPSDLASQQVLRVGPVLEDERLGGPHDLLVERQEARGARGRVVGEQSRAHEPVVGQPVEVACCLIGIGEDEVDDVPCLVADGREEDVRVEEAVEDGPKARCGRARRLRGRSGRRRRAGFDLRPSHAPQCRLVFMPLSRTADLQPFPREAFADVLEANEAYAAQFSASELSGWAVRELAVVTCMDSRIDPLNVLGMKPGDVKILRNAGARVTEDVLRTLVLATYLLGVTRVLVMPHTDCKMASGEEADVHQQIAEKYGIDTRSIEIRTVTDPLSALITDVVRVRAFPLLPPGLVVGGALLDVSSGRLQPLDV